MSYANCRGIKCNIPPIETERFTMQKKFVIVSLLLLLFAAQSAFADVHKWKDADGKTHYGDAPTAGRTEIIRTDKQTSDQIANGERIRAQARHSGSSGATDYTPQNEYERRLAVASSLRYLEYKDRQEQLRRGSSGTADYTPQNEYERRLAAASSLRYLEYKDRQEQLRLQRELKTQNAPQHDNRDTSNWTARYPAEQNAEQNAPPMYAPPIKDTGMCMGNCGSEQGMCIGNCASSQGQCIAQCNGNGQCIGNCASSQGMCMGNCGASNGRCVANCSR